MKSDSDPTAEFLDLVYPDYTNKKKTDKEIKFIIQNTPKNGTILDLGCGTGRHSIPLIKRGFKLVCFDGSKNMLKVLNNSKLH